MKLGGIFLEREPFYIIAHRGYAPKSIHENTLEAFDEAVRFQASMIETDIRILKDGTLVCAHDSTWQGILLKDMTYDEWTEKTFTKEGWRPPTLKEVLKRYQHTVPLNLEIKDVGIEEKVLMELEGYQGKELWISSFEDDVIRRMKELNNGVKTALVVGRSVLKKRPKHLSYWDDYFPERRLRLAKADAVCPHYLLVNQSFVERMKKESYPIYAWTVNQLERMKKLKSYGINGLFTDQLTTAMKILQ